MSGVLLVPRAYWLGFLLLNYKVQFRFLISTQRPTQNFIIGSDCPFTTCPKLVVQAKCFLNMTFKSDVQCHDRHWHDKDPLLQRPCGQCIGQTLWHFICSQWTKCRMGHKITYKTKQKAYNSCFIQYEFLIASMLIVYTLSGVHLPCRLESAELAFDKRQSYYIPSDRYVVNRIK